jgi:hypothetical protein
MSVLVPRPKANGTGAGAAARLRVSGGEYQNARSDSLHLYVTFAVNNTSRSLYYVKITTVQSRRHRAAGVKETETFSRSRNSMRSSLAFLLLSAPL